MKAFNAIIKNYGIQVSERYYESLELWLELEVEGGGGVCFSVWGPWNEEYKNMFAYSVKRVLDIADVDDLKNLKGAPIRAIFDGNADDPYAFVGSKIIGIKHFLKDDEFILEEDPMYEDVKINNKL